MQFGVYFGHWVYSKSVLIQLEAGTERYFQVIMFGVLYKVVLPFGSVLEIVSSLI